MMINFCPLLQSPVAPVIDYQKENSIMQSVELNSVLYPLKHSGTWKRAQGKISNQLALLTP